MKRALKTYKMELRAEGPVFIGSGKEIQKKEYLFLNRHTLGVIDVEKLYQLAKHKGLAGDMERFMVQDTREDLKHWAERNRIKPDEMKKCMRYVLDAGDIQQEKGRMQIMACMKDPYGLPYVPGSSVKGMLRTILLGADMLSHPEKYAADARKLKDDLYNRSDRRNHVLKANIAGMENRAFRTLNRPESRPGDAVNDWMSGVIIGDSEPLSMEDIIVCQKWEKHVEGKERTLNLLRECIRPGTVIRCRLTIDETVASLTGDAIMEAAKQFYGRYEKVFQNRFDYQSVRPISDYTVFLGGGSGFVSKTMIYALYDRREGTALTADIFRKTGVPDNHMHRKDPGWGVSPHILKCTRYKGKEYMMGQCTLRIQ